MPTRRSFLLGGLAAAAMQFAPRRGHGREGAAPEAGFVDLMPEFWRAYASAEGAADRARALHDAFFAPRASLYASAGLKPGIERVARWLPEFDAMADDVRRLAAGFPAVHAAHVRRFARALPDFDHARTRIYLLPSLFAFDGHLEPGGEGLPLFIGADGLVRYHGSSPDLSVFLDHESFHLYQFQVAPGLIGDPAPPVYGALWIEGTATYASERLNPDAGLLHVLLDDAALAGADAGTRRAVASAMLDALDSTDEADAARFFSAGESGPFPARGGYLVGLEVARRIGRELSLAELPRLQGPALRERVARELAALATGQA